MSTSSLKPIDAAPPRAKTLEDVASHTILEPLKPDDKRYADLSRGRSIRDLEMLKQYLENCRRTKRYACATLTGHRGCGKSTELQRLIEDLRADFHPFYVVVDASLEETCEYPDLFLWLVYVLVEQLDKLEKAPDKDVVDGIVDWFAEKYIESTMRTMAELKIEAQAEAKSGFSFFGLGLKLLARVKASLTGSQETREKTRRNVEQYAEQLIGKLNILLDQVAQALGTEGRRVELLIVIDNLDRLQPNAGRKLFIVNGEQLKKLHSHVVYTAPVAIALAPDRITRVFENHFTLPTIDPTKEAGVKALVDLIQKRIVIKNIFDPPKLVGDLARMSGGSPRDLIRLLNYAQLDAQAAKKKHIQRASATAAITRLKNDYKNSLVPAANYYPLLVRIDRSGLDGLEATEAEDDAKSQVARNFLRQLLNNGAVLEYNGGENKFVVHPAVQLIPAFQDEKAKPDNQPGAANG